MGDLQGAMQALKRALVVAPRHGLAHFHLGSCLGRSGHLDGALLEFQAVVEYAPGTCQAQSAQANLQAAADHIDEAPEAGGA